VILKTCKKITAIQTKKKKKKEKTVNLDTTENIESLKTSNTAKGVYESTDVNQ